MADPLKLPANAKGPLAKGDVWVLVLSSSSCCRRPMSIIADIVVNNAYMTR